MKTKPVNPYTRLVKQMDALRDRFRGAQKVVERRENAFRYGDGPALGPIDGTQLYHQALTCAAAGLEMHLVARDGKLCVDLVRRQRVEVYP